MRNRAWHRKPGLVLLAWLGLSGPAAAPSLDRLDTIGPYLDACVTKGLSGERFAGRREVTLRTSYRRDGSMIGIPAVTFSFPPAAGTEQKQFIDVLQRIFFTCAPLPFSKALGEAIAGRPYSYRIIHQPKQDIRL
jgi:hypothetical protein